MSGKRILFIDGDEAFIRDIAGGVEHQGYVAVLTGSSVEGVELARTERPDLIVVSVELTPAAGWSVCTRLKKDEELKDIPLILTSSTSTQDTFEKHKKLKTRADEYLLKPYSVDELLRLAGPLLGVAEPVSEDDLIASDDEVLGGEYGAGSEEEIQVASDEPLANGHDLGDPLDPLDGGDPLGGGGDALLDEASLGELDSEDLEAPAAQGLSDSTSAEDMDAFEQSFDALSGADEPAPELPVQEQAYETAEGEQPLEAVAEGEGLNGFEAEAPLADFGDGLNLETAGDGEATASPPDEAFGTEELASPPEHPLDAEELLEVASEEPVAAQPPEVSFEDDQFDVPLETAPQPRQIVPASTQAAPAPVAVAPVAPMAVISAADSNRIAELEAQVASLDAELEGFRATEGNHHAELERLRAESNKKDEEAEKLQDQIRERDRQIRELKDSDSRASVEAAKSRDERIRKEAQLKALTQKTEQMSTNAQKLERDLATAREEAANVAPLQARVAELEQQLQVAQAAAAEAKSLRDDVEKGRRDLDRVRAAHGQAVIDLESTRSDLEASRIEATEAKRVGTEQTALAESLQKKLTVVEQQMNTFAAQAQAHGDRAGKARAQLLALAEELGLTH
jgi:CheY-like chemotaxis protein